MTKPCGCETALSTYEVEVGGGAEEVALDVVAALVVAEALVQGLVQVADEVREELEGLPRSKRGV